MAAPTLIGYLAQRYGFGTAFSSTAVAYAVAARVALIPPETKGQELSSAQN